MEKEEQIMEIEYSIKVQCLASICGAIVSRIVTHPFDTLKTRIQMDSSLHPLKHCYRGCGVALMGGIPGLCLYLPVYESVIRYQSNHQILSDFPLAKQMIAAMIAEMTGGLCFTPMEIIKQHLQCHPHERTIPLVQKWVRERGLTSLWKGYGMSLLVYAPYTWTYFTSFEIWRPKRTLETAWMEWLQVSAQSAALAAIISSPADLIKVRYQSQFVTHLGRVSWQTWWKATAARLLWAVPCATLSMATYESVKPYLIDI